MTPPETPRPPPRSVRLPRELKKSDRSMTYLLHRAQQLARDIFREEMGVIGFTRRQFTFLLTLSNHPGLSQKELAAEMGADVSTIAELSQRMEAMGLIIRERRPSSPRGFNLTLTLSGKRRLKNARLAAARADRALLKIFPAQDQRAVLTGLMAMAELITEREKCRTDKNSLRMRKRK